MKESKVLKLISYILIPVIVSIIIISAFYMFAKHRSGKVEAFYSKNYFNTDYFLSEYMFRISDAAQRLIYNNKEYSYTYDDDKRICYQISDGWYEIDFEEFKYLILYKDLAITNVELTTETDTIEEIKAYLDNSEYKRAKIINGVVDANSEIIMKKAIQYYDNFRYSYYKTVTNSNIDASTLEIGDAIDDGLYGVTSDDVIINTREFYTTKITDFEIYSMYKEEIILNSVTSSYETFIINAFSQFEEYMIPLIPMSSVLLFIILIYLVNAIGHSKNVEGIDLKDIDKIPIEIILLITSIIVLLFIFACDDLSFYKPEGELANLMISFVVATVLITYIAIMVTFVTIIKRIKAKTLFSTSWLFKLIKYILGIIKIIISKAKQLILRIINTFKPLLESVPYAIKLFGGFAAYIVISVFFILNLEVGGFVIVCMYTSIILYLILQEISSYKRIEKHLKEMYEGVHTKKLNEIDFTKYFRKVVVYVNDISKGFDNAVEEGLKSERLKTELITNVSHDIKTPLTSIINYVDLIKKENIDNERIKEYIDILDQKTQRLKKLTEDLVEASKASSGNVKLIKERIYLKELLNQCLGEFEDKFKDKGLTSVLSLPEESISIIADNRYMYRIIENLFSNISKYAENNTRIYIDVKTFDDEVSILIKNISKERLNITAEELMQRFVRGDKSRTTEGSGLGLSISKSLTELQGGKFNLNIDGDLFKIELKFYIA